MNEPIADTIPDRAALKREEIIKTAAARFKLWVEMGVPCAPPSMNEHQYNSTYKGRLVLNMAAFQRNVLEEIQTAKKAVFCPSCREDDLTRGVMRVSQMYVKIEDDPMTTFAALAHFHCHGCDFEEYHPLKADPRAAINDSDVLRQKERARLEAVQYARQGLMQDRGYVPFGNALMGQANELYGRQGTSSAEREAMYRLIQKYKGQKL